MSIVDSASLKFWELVADIGTWAVILGVAGEGLEITVKILEHKCKNEKFLAWCQKHKFSIEIWGGIFWAIVVLGLATEFKGNHESQKITGAENARLTTQAAKAIERAGNAEKEAAQANERAAKFEKQAEEIRSTNLVLQTKLMELQVKVNGRTVSQEQLETIRRMTPAGVQISIVSMMTGEPVDFSRDLAKAFAEAGAVVSLGGEGNMFLNGSDGLHVRFDHADQRYVSIFKALEICGWQPTDKGDMPRRMLIQVHIRPTIH